MNNLPLAKRLLLVSHMPNRISFESIQKKEIEGTMNLATATTINSLRSQAVTDDARAFILKL